MTYTVVWKPDAENELARLWNEAPDRQAVAAASDMLDALLKNDPFRYSEGRVPPARVMFVDPLGISFDVSEPDRLVTVWAVWRCDQSHGSV